MILGKIIKPILERDQRRKKLHASMLKADLEINKLDENDLPTKLYKKKFTMKQWSKVHNDAKKLLLKNYHVVITIHYTQKQWNKFKINEQQILSNRYEIILTDYETRNEKIIKNLKKINLKNFDIGMKKFDEAQTDFWKQFEKGLGSSTKKKKKVKVF